MSYSVATWHLKCKKYKEIKINNKKKQSKQAIGYRIMLTKTNRNINKKQKKKIASWLSLKLRK